MKILFADDEVSLQELMRRELPGMGHTVAVCPDGLTAIAALENDSFDCLLVDLDMPGATGLQVIEAAKEKCPDADSIILTGKGTLDTAIAALRTGVFDYLTKPCRLAEIDHVLAKIAQKRDLTRKYKAVKQQLKQIEGERKLIGTSKPMQQVGHLIDRIASSNATVTILGETGTGKELVAKAIHDRSPRAEHPFITINCGALPENLIESELFGHRKGSFTGADTNRTGLFQVAHEGTLFLDEIGELPKNVQSKLLRFLESGEIRRIGDNNTTTCDVRIICATLKNLESMVQAKTFRDDLWFRINTFDITLPPLRSRIDDLPQLILHLATRFHSPLLHNRQLRSINDLFTSNALQLMEQYYWPGNIRQLANAIEHSLILTDSLPIDTESLPQSIRIPCSDSHSPHTDTQAHTQEPPAYPSETERERFCQRRPDRPITRPRDIPATPGSGVYTPLPGTLTSPAITPPQATNSRTENAAMEELLSFDPHIPVEAKTLRDLEMDAIMMALERNDGNKSKAAEELGISLKTLYNKLNQSNEDKKTA